MKDEEIVEILKEDFTKVLNKYYYSIISEENVNKIKIDILHICRRYKEAKAIPDDIGFNLLVSEDTINAVINRENSFEIIQI